ncbi:MAG: glycosyltransferase [Lentisphaeria bacterium]|nr:glycosyltransferase [Lentisphaeria bacterium]
MTQPCISIIIPVYGVEEYIDRCARSLFEQTMKEGIEFVFVNDCTEDQSIDILEKILMEYPHRQNQIKIINHEINRGLGETRNTGLINAQGAYVWFVDSDDSIVPEAAAELLELCGCRDIDVLYFHADKMLPDMSHDDFGAPFSSDVIRLDEVLEKQIPLSACTAIFRKDFLLKNNLQFVPDLLHEDSDFSFRLFVFNPRVMFSEKQYYCYDNSRGGSIINSKSFRLQSDNIRILKRCSDFLAENHVPVFRARTIYEKIYRNCIVSNFPLDFIFAGDSKQLIKENKTAVINCLFKSRNFSAVILGGCLAVSVDLFIFQLKFFQRIACIKRVVFK